MLETVLQQKTTEYGEILLMKVEVLFGKQDLMLLVDLMDDGIIQVYLLIILSDTDQVYGLKKHEVQTELHISELVELGQII